ncbi:MAG: ABC transporter substrate-binding protein [Eubacteriales bacterium]|jgi:iron complex transport system substrate-binding protein
MKNSAFRFLTLLLSVIILLIPPAGCGVREKAAGENHVSFTDALGRDVSVEKNPERVAALLGSFADVWILSGGAVAATAEDGWEDFGLELEGAVNLGGAHSPSLELLLSADPDFVIASASTASNVEMKDTLENAGITVAYFDVDNFEDYLNMLDICTDITGRKDLYETNGLTIKAQIDRIKEKVAGGGLSEKERSVLLLRASSGFVKAKGSEGTVLGEMLSDLGCINLADSDTSLLDTLSVEAVIRNEPYRIFVVTMGDDTEKAMENFSRMTEENPAWGTLEAVAGGRVHIMDRALFNKKPNAKWAESYEILSEILLSDK